ncbi:MAG: ArnT family glycosyltransferase [Bryobacteraceae bacterium]
MLAGKPLVDRYFAPLAAILILLSGLIRVTTVMEESQTWDEAMHIKAGFGYWTNADFRDNPQHPPLIKLIAAFPLLFMNVERVAPRELFEIEAGRQFLFENRSPADRILLAARLGPILLSLGLTLAVAWWTRKRFGAIAGLLALFLIGFDPNLLAHGRYVTNDVPMALLYFLSCALWIDFVETGGRGRLAAAGIVLGLTLATKFSSVLLLPLLPVLYWVVAPANGSLRHWVRSCVALFLTAAFVVWLVYMPGRRPRDRRRLREVAVSNTAAGRTMRWVSARTGLRTHPYWAGLDKVAEHNRSGHLNYFLGRVSEESDWRYFPVAFLVKSPLSLFGLWLLAIAGIRRTPWTRAHTALAVACAAFFAFCVASNMNLGIRYLFPVYPLMIVLAASVAARMVRYRAGLASVVMVLALHTLEAVQIHPYYLSFFNAAAGGPEAGPRYLLDSNIDWGQDLDRFLRYCESLGVENAGLTYFGSASWSHSRVRIDAVAASWETWKTERFDGVAASSVTPLYGLYVPWDDLTWLRKRPPTARIGYSIYVWDLRKKK